VIAATGQSTFVAYGGSDAGYGNGTSFSSPIIAGMTACLMQGFPEMSALDIMEALKESGSQHSAPDNLLGWGIPDYGIASDVLTTIRDNRNIKKPVVAIYPNPTSQGLTLDLTLDTAELVRVELVSNSGALLFKREYNLSNNDHIIQIDHAVISLMSGVYYVRVTTSEYTEVVKFVKQ
jgi:subtilisin family serine protease